MLDSWRVIVPMPVPHKWLPLTPPAPRERCRLDEELWRRVVKVIKWFVLWCNICLVHPGPNVGFPRKIAGWIKTNKTRWFHQKKHIEFICKLALLQLACYAYCGCTAWVLYKNSLYKNLRGSNPRRTTYFQVYQIHSTLRIWGTLSRIAKFLKKGTFYIIDVEIDFFKGF